jgi:hypothetical protein
MLKTDAATLHADMWLKRSHISAVSVSQSSFDGSRKAVVMLVPEKPNSEMGEVRQACICICTEDAA